jgi:hypothetical protein
MKGGRWQEKKREATHTKENAEGNKMHRRKKGSLDSPFGL